MNIEEIYDLELKYQEVYKRTKDYTRNDFVIELIKKDDENQQLKDLIVEKNNQLKEIQNKHTDYTQVNILRMKLDAIEKARKEAIEFINKKANKGYNFGLILQNEEIDKLLEILDIDKGE